MPISNIKLGAKVQLARLLTERHGLEWFVTGMPTQPDFTDSVLAFSFPGQFIYSPKSLYLNYECRKLARYRWTMSAKPRGFFKSVGCYAEILQTVFCSKTNVKIVYLGYRQKAAVEHVKNIIAMMNQNPYFYDLINNNPEADTKFDVTNTYGARITCEPHGISSGLRGLHCDHLVLDDAYKEDADKYDPTIVNNVNNLLKTVLIQLVKPGGIFRIVGTRMTQLDMFEDKKLKHAFHVEQVPAILNEKSKKVVWPEWMSYKALAKRRRVLGDSIFDQEFQCSPAVNTHSRIDSERFYRCVDTKLKNLSVFKPVSGFDILAGLDIGERRHPSHLNILKREMFIDEDKINRFKFTQLLTKWFDRMEIASQLPIIYRILADFGVISCRFDNTNGILNVPKQRGELPPCMTDLPNAKNKNEVRQTATENHSMAAYFADLIDRGHIKFINDQRQSNSILSIEADNLKAPDKKGAHGDAFWSSCLAVTSNTSSPRIASL